MDQMSNSINQANGPEQWVEGRVQGGNSTFDNIKSAVADKLHTAASTIHEKAGPGENNALSDYGRQAADWLDRSADYVRDFDPQQVKTEIENQVRRNPGRSLLIAGAAGLILGALFRRR